MTSVKELREKASEAQQRIIDTAHQRSQVYKDNITNYETFALQIRRDIFGIGAVLKEFTAIYPEAKIVVPDPDTKNGDLLESIAEFINRSTKERTGFEISVDENSGTMELGLRFLFFTEDHKVGSSIELTSQDESDFHIHAAWNMGANAHADKAKMDINCLDGVYGAGNTFDPRVADVKILAAKSMIDFTVRAAEAMTRPHTG